MARITIMPDGKVTFSCGSEHVVHVLVPKDRLPQIPDDGDEGSGGRGGDDRGRGGSRGAGASPGGGGDGDDGGGGEPPIFLPPPILPFLARKPPQERMHLSVLRVRSLDEFGVALGDTARAWSDHPARPRDLVVYLAQTEIDIPTLTKICGQLPEDTDVTVVLTTDDA
jgi:hypothetical protein